MVWSLKLLHWFASYLSNKKQITKVGTATSDMASVNFGVPQGSILGLLLFTLCINSLPSIVSNCKVNLYSDDTALFYAGKSVDDIGEKVIADMGKVAVWMEESKLTLNASKTKTCFLDPILSSAKPPLNFLLEIHMLTIVPSFKYLGLHFDQYLSWNLHVDQITKSVTKYIVFFFFFFFFFL